MIKSFLKGKATSKWNSTQEVFHWAGLQHSPARTQTTASKWSQKRSLFMQWQVRAKTTTLFTL